LRGVALQTIKERSTSEERELRRLSSDESWSGHAGHALLNKLQWSLIDLTSLMITKLLTGRYLPTLGCR
jgi:hypothetical protein